MRVLIENYRGWDIYFDTEKEEFYTVSNEYDNEQNKRSFASAKKYIDDYIKQNSEFKPFKATSMPTFYDDSKEITIVGIRKDGAFMFEDNKGERQQLSKYSEGDYFLVNEENNVHFEQIKSLREGIKELQSLIKDAEKMVVKETLKSIKHRYINLIN